MFRFITKSKFYLFLFLLFQISVFFTLDYFENKTIKDYTESQISKFGIQHELIIEDFNLVSEVFYIEYEKLIADFLDKANNLENDDVQLKELRNQVLSIFQPIFENRKYFGVKTLHFHLKNRKSFLRLHNPKKYGDDLSSFRPVINKVARDLKFVIEFEGGRMFNGYRYVYPLFVNNQFVGSFEIGIDLNAFKNKLGRLNQSVYEYFLAKDYIERFSNKKEKSNFQKTIISEQFCVNREFNKENLENIEHVNKEISQNRFYKSKFQKREKFAYWDNERKYLVVFIPIANVLGEKIAFISRYTINSFYFDTQEKFISYKIFVFILGLIFFMLILFVIYERNLLDDIINFQKSIVIITDGRKIRKVNRAFLDFFGYSSLGKFKKKYNCICNLFLERENYLIEDMNGINWLDYIRDNNKKEHYAILYDREIDGESIFLVDLSENREFSDYSVVSFTDVTRLELKRKSLEFDALTGIYNRHKFNELLEYNCDYSSRYNIPLSFVMFDIDHFKKVNDIHGHQIGDKVLQNLSKLVKDTIRSVDIFSRWGGEEFIIIMPHTTVQNASKVAENLRKKIESTEIIKDLKITSSFGVTERNDFDTEHKLLERVDKALYLAKEKGRNQVKVI